MRFFKVEVALFKMGTPDFNKTAAFNLQIFTMFFPRNSVSHATHGKYANVSFAVTEQMALLHLAYKYVSDKLLNPANQVDPFYIVKLKC
jgi:hypothetical protein